MAAGNTPVFGQLRPPNLTDQKGTDWFQIWQQLNRVGVAMLVRVDKVTVAGVVGPVGQLDVTPLVGMVDGGANVSAHGSIKKIHYSRMQGGDSAVILDPKVGDVGIAVICDRDSSVVRKTKKPGPPGSRRRFDVADGVYVMTVLGDKPKRYVQFMDDGTVVVANATASEANRMECVVGDKWVQIKKKGVSDLHVTVDGQSGTIILGQNYVVGPDPYPSY